VDDVENTNWLKITIAYILMDVLKITNADFITFPLLIRFTLLFCSSNQSKRQPPFKDKPHDGNDDYDDDS